MPLTFIGMGIWAAKDISVRGLEELRAAEIAFAENYTAKLDPRALEELELLAGKEIAVLSREEVEDGALILEQAAEKNVAFIVPGDPMVSTTHTALQLEAQKRGIATRIIHASSILTGVIGETGLHTYKFGPPVTLPFWSEKYRPLSPYEKIAENKKRGLHTLVFLDVGEKPMGAREALALLMKMEGEKKGGIARPEDKLVVAGRIGSPTQAIGYGKIKRLLEAPWGEPPFVIVVPGELHFTEEEALMRYWMKPFGGVEKRG
ncbi:MAG: diphthine synthase [Candidatus Micrarchaeia archaeon]